MKFGVWAELESADRTSSIFRDHREWFMQYPDQFPADDELDDSASGRMLLNLTLPEVEEHLYRALDSLICENELDYFKLDMNRLFTHPGSAAGGRTELRYPLCSGALSNLRTHPAKAPRSAAGELRLRQLPFRLGV